MNPGPKGGGFGGGGFGRGRPVTRMVDVAHVDQALAEVLGVSREHSEAPGEKGVRARLNVAVYEQIVRWFVDEIENRDSPPGDIMHAMEAVVAGAVLTVMIPMVPPDQGTMGKVVAIDTFTNNLRGLMMKLLLVQESEAQHGKQ